MREDTYSNTEADAGRYEHERGRDADDLHERPDAHEVSLDNRPDLLRCPARDHNPTPEGAPNADGCYHCPKCGGAMSRPISTDPYVECSVYGCGFTFGTP